MNFDIVKQKYPSAVETDWHQHLNGGGWVANSASVTETVTVPDSAVIGYRARIGDRANIGDRASIGYGARIGDRASIGDGASIGDDARIDDGYAGDILYISTATGHPITATRETHRMVQIGCRRMTIEEWAEKADVIGRAEKYSPATIAVYRGLLAAVLAWMDAPLDAEEEGERNG